MSDEQANLGESPRNGFKWAVIGCLVVALGIIAFRSWTAQRGNSAETETAVTVFEPLDGTKVRLAGTGIAGQELRVIINQERVEPIEVDENGEWSVETTAFGQTGLYDISVEDVETGEPTADPIPVSVVVQDSNIASFDSPFVTGEAQEVSANVTIPPATQIPTPIPTEMMDSDAEAPLPEVLSFQANVSRTEAGNAAQFIWNTTAENGLILQLVDGAGDVAFSQPVAAAGDQTVDLLPEWGDSLIARLQDATGTVNAETQISVACLINWAVQPGPSGCPTTALGQSRATQQLFDNGVMIWVQDLDQIYAISADGQSWQVADQFEHGVDAIVDDTIVAPEGKQQPMWGFGKVWREDEALRTALGWALSESTDYEGRYQCSDANVCYLSTIDGSVLVVPTGDSLTIESGWTLVAEETP